MRATRLLESQHRQVESLLTRLQTRGADRQRLLQELADALTAHMLIEEEIFYPASTTVRGARILQSYEEHEAEVPVLQRLVATRDEDAFDARLAVLAELIQAHVAREENELFPEMDRAVDQQSSEMIGEQMEQRFQQVVQMGHQNILLLRPIQVGTQCPQQGQQQGQAGQPQGQAGQPSHGSGGQRGGQSGKGGRGSMGRRGGQPGRKGGRGQGQGQTS